MKRFILFVLFLMSFAPLWAMAEESEALPQPAAPPILSLTDILRDVYLDNPTIEQARSELKAVHESLPQAHAGWKPSVDATAAITAADIDGSNFGGSDGSTEKAIGIGLNQPLFRGGRTLAEIRAAKYEIAAARFAILNVEQDVLLLAVQVYMDVIRDRALVRLGQQNRDVILRQLEATRERFEVGELTRTDVAQAEARLARAEADLITARANMKTSRAAFVNVIGETPGRLVEPEITVSLPGDLEDATQIALDQAPSVLEAVASHAASEKEVDSVYGELLPEVSFNALWDRSYDPQPGSIDESTTRSVGISASIPLYQAGSVRSRVRQAKQLSNRDYIDILEEKRSARERVVAAWEQLEAARAEIDARNAQIRAAEIAREGVYQEEQVGARTVLDTLDADQELLDAEVSLVTAGRNEVVATFTLAAALGILTPVNLGFPEVQKDYDEHLNAIEHTILSLSADPLAD